AASLVATGQQREDADARTLLGCARRKRPRRRGAANQRDELAPLQLRDHSMTSSARASNVGGISRPSVFAVLRLMTSSIFVGCSTGSSAGCAPFKILST